MRAIYVGLLLLSLGLTEGFLPAGQGEAFGCNRLLMKSVTPKRFGEDPREVSWVVIDPGHGGDDTGGIGLYNLIEKDVVVQIAHLIAIEAAWFPNRKILLTRSDDRYLSPQDRLAAALGADLFISLHLDFSYDPRVRGITALIPTHASPTTQALAEALRKQLIPAAKVPDLGTKTAPLWLRRLTIPAVQLNLGFVTNPEEARKLGQLAYQKRFAQAILEGVEEFLRAITSFEAVGPHGRSQGV